ncbi:MAG: serine hydrolase [Mycobacteriales bacterium]
MPPQLNRRSLFGLSAAAATTALVATAAASRAADEPQASAAPTDARDAVAASYGRETAKARGTWSSYISIPGTEGAATPVVQQRANDLVEAYSVNKIAVATAVLDKIDRGQLRLDQRVDVSSDIVDDGGGVFGLDGAYPSSVTLGHVMAAMLTLSDNTAVRLCGLVAPAKEINDILTAKGFPKTQVEPLANPNRFFLGQTTPRETHDLLQKLVKGQLLSETSTSYLLKVLRSPIAFTDGIRLDMSTDERLRVATKAGWFKDGRNEAGLIFDGAGKPVLTYSLFAAGAFAGAAAANDANFSITHPALRARAAMGRVFLDVGSASGANPRLLSAVTKYPYRPSNGG